ncbi:MAG: hypothetical protein HC786_09075 [Richelia sp. CSU_2_1]|nr:hypothetical protein [Microcoleus sp. SU_5_6]NJL67980.1 hypothetical protein [Microcoleus sp. SM1_3_4]NJR22294.1 hypothetical protein [Richelia sp. CSU_2_1]
MNNILKQIIPSFLVAAIFAFPAAVPAQSLTPSQIQQVNSGLFRSNSQDFFQQGNRQLEKEIAILLQKLMTGEGEILEVEENLRSHLCHQDFTISARDSEIVTVDRIASLNRRVSEICGKN